MKEYFYQGQDDNNKAWSITKSYTGRNTFIAQATHNQPADEICEEMAQMRNELRLVLKHVIGGAEKVNAVNYLTKPSPPTYDFYYEEDSYAMNEQMGVSDQTPKAPIRRIGANVKEIKVKSIGITTERVTMFDMEPTIVTTTSIGVTMVTKMIEVGLCSSSKSGSFS